MAECDERRALLVKHGYPPDLPPRGVTGPPGEIVNGYKSQAGQIVPARLRNWVCTLEGVIIDGHSDQGGTGLCVLCGRETTEGNDDQCCPMGTYGTDAAGDLRPECECPDDCECLCDGCACRTAGTGWDTDDFWREDPASLRPDAPVDPL